MDTVKVQVSFTVSDTPYGSFSDAIYFTEAEWAANPDVEAMKQARVDAYVAARESMAAPQEPTQEQIEAHINAIDEQIVKLNNKKSSLQAKLNG